MGGQRLSALGGHGQDKPQPWPMFKEGARFDEGARKTVAEAAEDQRQTQGLTSRKAALGEFAKHWATKREKKSEASRHLALARRMEESAVEGRGPPAAA